MKLNFIKLLLIGTCIQSCFGTEGDELSSDTKTYSTVREISFDELENVLNDVDFDKFVQSFTDEESKCLNSAAETDNFDEVAKRVVSGKFIRIPSNGEVSTTDSPLPNFPLTSQTTNSKASKRRGSRLEGFSFSNLTNNDLDPNSPIPVEQKEFTVNRVDSATIIVPPTERKEKWTKNFSFDQCSTFIELVEGYSFNKKNPNILDLATLNLATQTEPKNFEAFCGLGAYYEFVEGNKKKAGENYLIAIDGTSSIETNNSTICYEAAYRIYQLYKKHEEHPSHTILSDYGLNSELNSDHFLDLFQPKLISSEKDNLDNKWSFVQEKAKGLKFNLVEKTENKKSFFNRLKEHFKKK